MKFSGGLPETKCGAGSTLAHTAPIRAWLPRIFRELHVTSVLDAPCGDFHWMAHTDLRGITYVGFDYDEEHCRRAAIIDSIAGCHPAKKIIHCWNIIDKPIPCCSELMLCRDFWQHLPTVRIKQAIERYLESNIPWLLTTSHVVAKNEDIIHEGMYRPINVTIKPFGFPHPRKMISDGPSRILGLWHRNDIH